MALKAQGYSRAVLEGQVAAWPRAEVRAARALPRLPVVDVGVPEHADPAAPSRVCCQIEQVCLSLVSVEFSMEQWMY